MGILIGQRAQIPVHDPELGSLTRCIPMATVSTSCSGDNRNQRCRTRKSGCQPSIAYIQLRRGDTRFRRMEKPHGRGSPSPGTCLKCWGAVRSSTRGRGDLPIRTTLKPSPASGKFPATDGLVKKLTEGFLLVTRTSTPAGRQAACDTAA